MMLSFILGGPVAERFIGSVVEDKPFSDPGPHPPGVTVDNTTVTIPGRQEGSGIDSYIIVVAVVGTVLPLICIILSIVAARRLWVKFRGEGYPGKVEREDTAQTSLKSRDGGSRKSSRASRVTKDPSSRDQLIPQDSIITSPSEGPVTEEGDAVEEIVVGEADLDQAGSELTSKVSVSMKNHSLVVEVEGAPDTPTIQENGKTHLFTEAQVEPIIPKLAGDILKATNLQAPGDLGVYLKRSKSERVRPRNPAQEEGGGGGEVESGGGSTTPIDKNLHPRVAQRRLSMGHHPHHSSHHLMVTPQRLTVDPETNIVTAAAAAGNFGLSTSDLSLDSNSSCNPTYKYGNQVSYAGGYYGYPVSQGYPAADRQSRRMHLVVPRGSGGGEESLGVTQQQQPQQQQQRDKVDRKTSLPNALDQQQQGGRVSPSRSVPSSSAASRGALNKQYSLPASARNTRYMPRHRHSFRHDRPHHYQHHDHAHDHPHVRSHSASLRAPHDHRPHVSRELHSPRLESPHLPRELHSPRHESPHMARELLSPRLESPHLTRELHSPRVETIISPVIIDEPSEPGTSAT